MYVSHAFIDVSFTQELEVENLFWRLHLRATLSSHIVRSIGLPIAYVIHRFRDGAFENIFTCQIIMEDPCICKELLDDYNMFWKERIRCFQARDDSYDVSITSIVLKVEGKHSGVFKTAYLMYDDANEDKYIEVPLKIVNISAGCKRRSFFLLGASAKITKHLVKSLS